MGARRVLPAVSVRSALGATPHIGAGLIGYDPERYFAHLVDNIGYDRLYELRQEGDGVWTYSGMRERARMNFNGDTLNVRWEYRPNGGALRIRPHQTADR